MGMQEDSHLDYGQDCSFMYKSIISVKVEERKKSADPLCVQEGCSQ